MKVLDWSKMPSGVPVVAWNSNEQGRRPLFFGRLLNLPKNPYFCPDEYGGIVGTLFQCIELREQAEFTYWPGGECPLPDGVMVEVVHRSGFERKGVATDFEWDKQLEYSDIIAHRILGLAEGWKYPHEV